MEQRAFASTLDSVWCFKPCVYRAFEPHVVDLFPSDFGDDLAIVEIISATERLIASESSDRQENRYGSKT
jgi:hypothetical protein